METSNSIQRLHGILDQISRKDEFKLDTPTNRDILEAIKDMKESSEKNSLVKVLEGIESGVLETVVRTGKSFDSVKLWKKWSIPRFSRYKLQLAIIMNSLCIMLML